MTKWAANSKKSGEVLMKQQAKLFVTDVMLVTPPCVGKGHGFSAGKKLGEAHIKASIAGLFRGVRAGADKNKAITDPRHLHKQNMGKKLPYEERTPVIGLKAYTKMLLKRVGILSSGWNSAATKLGSRVPAWISRHGTGSGQVALKFGWTETSIHIENNVTYANRRRELVGEVKRALWRRTRAINSQLASMAKRTSRQAGFK